MDLIIGRKPVLEAINSGEALEHVYILYGQTGKIIDVIRIAAKKHNVKCSLVPADKFKEVTSDPHAQGTAAIKQSQKLYSLDDIITLSKGSALPLILMLDSIQDPGNLGAILRTAECSGVDGVIITKHNSAQINETVRKASAGAAELLKMCQVNNLAQTIDELKENGFWIAGSTLEEARDYTTIDYNMPLAIIIGNEEKGIRRLTAEKCDFLIKIPMPGKIQSLNVSVAAGILLFEIYRQRRIHKTTINRLI